MTNVLALMKYWSLFISVVEMIEQAVPTDTPGAAKLDLALKTLLAWNSELSAFGPDLEKMVAFAKVIYTGMKAVKAA